MRLPKDGIDGLTTNRKIHHLAEQHPRNATPLHRKQSKSHSSQSEVPVCPHHAGEKLHFYCTSCNELVCQACLVLKHQGHQVDEVKEKYALQYGEMKRMLSEAKNKIHLFEKSIEKLQQHKK